MEGQADGEFAGQRLPMTAKEIDAIVNKVAILVDQKSSPTKRKPATLAVLQATTKNNYVWLQDVKELMEFDAAGLKPMAKVDKK